MMFSRIAMIVLSCFLVLCVTCKVHAPNMSAAHESLLMTCSQFEKLHEMVHSAAHAASVMLCIVQLLTYASLCHSNIVLVYNPKP